MYHMQHRIKIKRLFLLGLVVIVLCITIAFTPFGARITLIARFQIAELLAGESPDEYCLDSGLFYVRNEKTIRSLKQMLFRAVCEKKSLQDSDSTAEDPWYYLGSHRFGVAMSYHYQLGPVKYHFVFKESDYRIWRAYIDSTYNSGGLGNGMVLD